MKNVIKKAVKENKESKIGIIDVVLTVLCPPLETGVLIAKLIRNRKEEKEAEIRDREIEELIETCKNKEIGETNKEENNDEEES